MKFITTSLDGPVDLEALMTSKIGLTVGDGVEGDAMRQARMILNNQISGGNRVFTTINNPIGSGIPLGNPTPTIQPDSFIPGFDADKFCASTGKVCEYAGSFWNTTKEWGSWAKDKAGNAYNFFDPIGLGQTLYGSNGRLAQISTIVGLAVITGLAWRFLRDPLSFFSGSHSASTSSSKNETHIHIPPAPAKPVRAEEETFEYTPPSRSRESYRPYTEQPYDTYPARTGGGYSQYDTSYSQRPTSHQMLIKAIRSDAELRKDLRAAIRKAAIQPSKDPIVINLNDPEYFDEPKPIPLGDLNRILRQHNLPALGG
jgi:hypothetical protein